MSQVLLTSLNTLKTNYLFDQNLDDKFLISNIIKIQDFKIKPVLTNVVYDNLVSGLTHNTLTADQITLLEYVEPVIAWLLISEVSYATAYKLKNKGVEQGDMDRFNELVKISQKYQKDGERYLQILIEYLNDIEETTEINNLTDNFKTGITLTGNKAYRDRYVYKTDLFRR